MVKPNRELGRENEVGSAHPESRTKSVGVVKLVNVGYYRDNGAQRTERHWIV